VNASKPQNLTAADVAPGSLLGEAVLALPPANAA